VPDLPLADVLAAILALSLAAYVLFGGADFGGGVWDLLASGPRKARQREVIAHAIAPIWEANHVWLILAIVLAFTCFPEVFARLGTVLHIPLSLMLIGIVLRGSAFIFRSYDTEELKAQRRWGRVFAIASLATPVLLGVCIGAVASGRLVPPADGDFVTGFVEPWLTPFALAIGLMTLTIFAFLAAVFLTLETHDPELADDFRRRGLIAGVAVFVAAFAALALAPHGAPLVQRALVSSTWAMPFHLVTGAVAVAVLAALWFRKYRLDRRRDASSLYRGRVGAGTVSLYPSPGSHGNGSGRARPHAAPRPHCAGGGRCDPAPVAAVSFPGVQELPGRPGRAWRVRR